VLAATTALTGAVIAAFTAGRRQKRELKHDRDLKDLTELRDVLDEAAISLKETIHQCHQLMGHLSAWELRDDQNDPDAKADYERLYREGFAVERARTGDARDRMIVAGQRIAIRLGRDKPIYDAYQIAIRLVIEVIRQVVVEDRRQHEANAPASTFAAAELNAQLGQLERGFVDQAVALVASHIPSK
jgi:hypothetical protein